MSLDMPFPYENVVVRDPKTGDMPPVGSEGQIFDPIDTNFTTPLTPLDASGNAISALTSLPDGFLTYFESDLDWVRWKSGNYVFNLVTTVPVPGPEGAAGVGVNGVTLTGDDLVFSLSNGDTTPPVKLPVAGSDSGVASYITTPGSATDDALGAAFVRVAAVDPAFGDGVTDATAHIQARVNSAATFGLSVFIPGGAYKLTNTVNLPSNTELRLAPGAIIDVTAMPTLAPSSTRAPAFQALGTLDTAKTLTADAAKGTKVLTLATGHGIVAGDWVKITSSLPWGGTNQPAGEIQRVASTTTTTLTVSEPLYDTYATIDSAVVAKVTFCENVTITGGRIVGNPTDAAYLATGIRLDYARNVTVSGVTFRWIHYTGLFITDSVGVTAHDCHFNQALGVGLGYGIAASWAVQDLSVVACHSTRVRHLVALGGGSTRGGIARRVTVATSTASECFDAGLDFHPGAEDVVFIGNTISGSAVDGIVAQGGRFVISGNTIINSVRHGILVQNQTIRGFDGVISGNRIHGSKGVGISVAAFATAAYRVWSGLSITGNNVTDGGSYGISVINADDTFRVEGVVVSDNVIRRHVAHGIYLRGVRDAAVGTNQISDVAATMESVYIQASPDVAVTGNMISGGSRGIRIALSPDCIITGSRIKNTSGTGIGILTDASSTGTFITGNKITATTRLSIGAGTTETNNA